MPITNQKLPLNTIVEVLKSSANVDLGLKPGQFTTTQAIRMRNGFYLAEPVPVLHSTNAALGRRLSYLSDTLGIRKVTSIKTLDDRGHLSTTAVWERSEARA
jgi:hypothetical protein